MTPAFGLHAIAQFSALRIVDSLAEGTLIATFAGLVLRVTGRQNAGARFAVWFTALMAMAALPVISGGWWSRGGISGVTASRPAITLQDSWALYLFGVWAVLAVWSLIRVGRAVGHLHDLRKDCVPVDPAALHPLLQETLRRNQMNRQVVLCTSEQCRVPTAIGLAKPAIVIPGWAMQELSPEELNQVLLHELAHVRRWDDWTNLAQQLVKAVLFFHPAVWWIEKKVALEREMACDDAVLAQTASPRAYAECLAHLAERSFAQRGVALAQAVLGRIRQTSLRVAQILDVSRPTGQARTWKPAVLLIAGFAFACALCASWTPRLIAFQDSAPNRAAGPRVATLSTGVTSIRAPKEMQKEDVSASLPARIKQARLNTGVANTGVAHRRSDLRPGAVAMRSVASKPPAGAMVRLTGATSVAVPFTETVFVLIEGSESNSPDQPVYQIRVWRVMVLRQVEPTGSKAPRSET